MIKRLLKYFKRVVLLFPGINKLLGSTQYRSPACEYILKTVKGRGNIISTDGATLSEVKLEIYGSNNSITIGKNSSIVELEIFVRGNNNVISIGENCRFIKGGVLWVEDNRCRLIIGSSTSFVTAHLAVTETGSNIEIGEDCMFAYDIDVRTGDSHSILDEASGARINKAENVYIGNHVWVATHANILKGVKIMDNCIVGSGAVVVKGGAEDGVIYAGNPAKIVKRNINWSRERV